MPSLPRFDPLQVRNPRADGGTDGELLRRFQAGRDGGAFAELVRRHGPMVYGTCRRISGNGADADDAFQATFFILARSADRIRAADAVGAWLHGVAVKVARRAQQQAIRRRVRQMAAAKPEAVPAATPVADWWAVVDDELNRLPEKLRQVVLVCDLGGKSRSQAARELGWPEGTVAKRLTAARRELATRLTRRGVTLGVAGLAAGTIAVPGRLMAETISQATAFAAGPGAGSLAVRSLAEGVMRSMNVRVLKTWVIAGLVATAVAAGGVLLAAGRGEPPAAKPNAPKVVDPPGKAAPLMWKEKAVVKTPGWLPASVAYSPDGKTIVAGGTGGKVVAVDAATRTEKWTADVGGGFAAVAFTADGRSVLATSTDGARFLEAATGKPGDAIDEPESRPWAIGVFPDQPVDVDGQKYVRHKVIFGNSHGYFVKIWIDPNNTSTIKSVTVLPGREPADPNAVPLAVDPAGRSAIVTGPIDRATGKNVLWAWVAGNNQSDSPGNRVLEGHAAAVVAAAWSKDGVTAVTGDAGGRVIVWDAKRMKETRRLEFGGRVAALAVSADAKRVAAAVVGTRAEFFVWDAAGPANNLKPIHADAYDYSGPIRAAIAFSPDGRQLAGIAINTVWLSRLGELVGKLHVWETDGPNPPPQPAEEPPAKLTWKADKTIADPQFDSRSVAISPDGKKFGVSANNGLNTIVFDASTGTKLYAVSGQCARFIGKDIYTWAGSVKRFDADTGTERSMIPPPPKGALFSIGAQFSPNGKTIAGFDCMVMRIMDAATGADAVKLTGPGKQIRSTAKIVATNEVCWSRDGKRVVGIDLDYAVKPIGIAGLAIWDTPTGKQLVSRETTLAETSGRTILCFDFSPDGKTLAVGGLTSGKRGAFSLELLDATTLKSIRTTAIDSRDGGADVTAVAYSPDGATVAVAVNLHSGKGPLVRVCLYDAATGEIAHTLLPDHDTPPISSLAFSPDGKILIAATGSIFIDAQQKEILHRILIWRGTPKEQ